MSTAITMRAAGLNAKRGGLPPEDVASPTVLTMDSVMLDKHNVITIWRLLLDCQYKYPYVVCEGASPSHSLNVEEN